MTRAHLHRWPTLLLTALLVGCGLSEEQYNLEYEAKYCTEFDTCNTAGTECPVEEARAGQRDTEGCTYDKSAAKACLEGEWLCNTDIPEFQRNATD